MKKFLQRLIGSMLAPKPVPVTPPRKRRTAAQKRRLQDCHKKADAKYEELFFTVVVCASCNKSQSVRKLPTNTPETMTCSNTLDARSVPCKGCGLPIFFHEKGN